MVRKHGVAVMKHAKIRSDEKDKKSGLAKLKKSR